MPDPRTFGVRRWHPDSALLNSVAHGAKAWKGARPLIARGAADDAKRGRATEPHPLHHGDGRIVLAAGRIEARFISGHAVNADRLGHRDTPAVHPRNRRCRLL